MHKKIIIAGGGTGGHIFPAVAVANAIKEIAPNTSILFVGAKGKMEMDKVPQAGYQIIGLDIAGFNRSSLLKNVSLPFKLAKSFFQVRKIFKSFQPDAAFGVGGYSSFPVLRYAQTCGIPTFLHEANALGGKSNQLLAKKATLIFAGNHGMERFFPKATLVFSGNPVRKTLFPLETNKAKALQTFGLATGKTTILVIGGSLGAASINEAILAGLSTLQAANCQLIWQTGHTFFNKANAAAQAFTNIFTGAFINDMRMAYSAADLVISRAGAMSVTELCLAEKAAVFVPYPFAAEDHQTKNAMALVEKNAALMVKDTDAMQQLIATVIALAENDTQRSQFQHNIKGLAQNDADVFIATTILKHLHVNA